MEVWKTTPYLRSARPVTIRFVSLRLRGHRGRKARHQRIGIFATYCSRTRVSELRMGRSQVHPRALRASNQWPAIRGSVVWRPSCAPVGCGRGRPESSARSALGGSSRRYPWPQSGGTLFRPAILVQSPGSCLSALHPGSSVLGASRRGFRAREWRRDSTRGCTSQLSRSECQA